MSDEQELFVGIQAQGEAEAADFLKMGQAFIGLLNAIAKDVTKKPVHWQIEDRDPSVRIVVEPNGASGDELATIIANARLGLGEMKDAADDGAPAPVWPEHFTSEAIQYATKLLKLLEQFDALQLVTSTDVAPLWIDRAWQAPIRARRVKPPEWTSVDGELDLISVRHRPEFSLTEHATGDRIRCEIGPGLMERAKDCLDRRVVVEGLMRYSRTGRPSVLTEISSIWPRPKAEPVSSIIGTLPDLTGGVDSVEYVRRLREGDDGDEP